MTRDRTALKLLPSASRLLARILETPDLAVGVQSLPAPVLARVIDAVGLEDVGEIVAFASPAQIAEVFDLDLWRSERPGGDEVFDGDRFLVWLEVMMEAGDAFVAEQLASLPEDLVTLALRQHVLVFEIDALLAEMQGADEHEGNAIEKTLSNFLSEEIDEYQLLARRNEGWDSVLAAVLALDRDHHALLARILARLCAMTIEEVDREGGLQSVLTSEETLEDDVAADRADRRAEKGHVAPSDARAFLQLARQPIIVPPKEHDPVTRAYFRDLANPEKAERARRSAEREEEQSSVVAAGSVPSDLARVLLEVGVIAPQGRPAPQLGHAHVPSEPLLVRAMRGLAEIDPIAFAARSEEIAYVANVLLAGASIEGRRYRPAESVQKAIEVCSRGLELASKNADAIAILRDHPAEGLFRMAWSLAAVSSFHLEEGR